VPCCKWVGAISFPPLYASIGMWWADLYFLLLTCTYCIACSFKHPLLAAIISPLVKIIYSLYCLNFLVVKLRRIPIIDFWIHGNARKMIKFVKLFYIYIYIQGIIYSGITKIYYRKTLGHIFMKPVHIEGTTQKIFSQ